MACSCQEPKEKEPEVEFVVKLPSGEEQVVTGEHAAKVAVTMAGGGSYRRR